MMKMNKLAVTATCVFISIISAAFFSVHELHKNKERKEAYAYGVKCEAMGISSNLNPYRTKHEQQAWLDGWYKTRTESLLNR